jgi:prevent-host-death family protein
MPNVNVKEARKRFSELVDAVERGESVTITRRGRKVARMEPVRSGNRRRLPDLSDFRSELTLTGESMSETVIKQREKDRY